MMVLRTKRSLWKEWGALVAAILMLWIGIQIAFGFAESKKVLFGAPVFTQWFMAIGSPLMSAAIFYRWLGPRLGFPRIEIRPGTLFVVDILGRHSTIDLSLYGPAYAYESRGPVTIPYLVFYAAQKEAALRGAGSFTPPTDFTADAKVQLSRLIGKSLPAISDVLEAVNSVRGHRRETGTVSDVETLRLVSQHRRAERIGKALSPFLLIAAGFFEFVSERQISWFWVLAGLLAAIISIGLDRLSNSQHIWAKRVSNVLFFIILAALLYVVAGLFWRN